MNNTKLQSRLRLAKSEILGFFRWWAITLVETAPRWLIGVVSKDVQTQRLLFKSGSLYAPDGKAVIAPAAGSLGQVNIVLDGSDVFFRERWLPVASRHRWQAIMDFDFLSNAPFDANEICSDVELLELDENRELGRVRHAVCKHETVGLALSAARKTGLKPARISVCDADGGSIHFNFLKQPTLQFLSQRMDKLNVALIALVALGTVSVALNATAANQTEIAELEKQEAVLRQTAKPVLQKHGEVLHLIELDTWLRHVFENPTRFANLYEDVTLHMPEGTWLESLSYNDESLFMTGQTHDADDMVERLEKSELIDRAEFTTPLIRNARTGTDRFQMKLSLSEFAPHPATERQM